MKTTIPSPSSLKKGNVLALLNTLYTSGFAMASPGLPMLKDRTMHTLYAVSFIVYSLNCTADWIHVYCVLRGYVTSYPLETWMVVWMVSTVVAGSMLNGLLLMLCVENAFAHRLNIKPYRSGFAIILEAFIEWIQAFNNFRVAYLVMLLHDTPMTTINFFLIASCRCSGPQIIPWSLLFSCVTSNLSLMWRLCMLYFAYKRMICPLTTPTMTQGVHRFLTPHEHLLSIMSTSDADRLEHYDETWPIRWARLTIYGADSVEQKEMNQDPNAIAHRGIANMVTNPFLSAVLCPLRLVACVLLTLGTYCVFLLSCCAPCCYHYTCTRESFHHRHAFARTFVRYISYGFHYSMFSFSVLLCTSLITLNTLLITSAQLLGSHSIPPEINQLCISTSSTTNTISASFASTSFIGDPKMSSDHDTIVCKPIWEDGGLGLGLRRLPAGPWQTRRKLDNRNLLAISTRVTVNGSDHERPFLLLQYDRAVLTRLSEEDEKKFHCRRSSRSNWTFELPVEDNLGFPYFVGCKKNWKFQEKRLIDCHEAEIMVTTSFPRSRYPAGAGAYYPTGERIPQKKLPNKISEEDDIDRGDLRHTRRRRPKKHVSRKEI